MLLKICTRISERFVRAKMIEPDLAEWCIYWLQKKILTGILIFAMLMLGSLLYGAEITVCFLLGLLPLRRRLNGYHTRSPYTCAVLSLGTMLVALLLQSAFDARMSLLFSVVNFAVCFVLITWFLMPQNDAQLHLTKAEIKENHKLAVQTIIFISFAVATIALLLQKVEYLSACQMGIMVVVLSTAYKTIKQKRSEQYIVRGK